MGEIEESAKETETRYGPELQPLAGTNTEETVYFSDRRTHDEMRAEIRAQALREVLEIFEEKTTCCDDGHFYYIYDRERLKAKIKAMIKEI